MQGVEQIELEYDFVGEFLAVGLAKTLFILVPCEFVVFDSSVIGVGVPERGMKGHDYSSISSFSHWIYWEAFSASRRALSLWLKRERYFSALPRRTPRSRSLVNLA